MPNKDKKDVESYGEKKKGEARSQAGYDRDMTTAEYLNKVPKKASKSDWKKYESKKADQMRWIAKGEKASKSARYEAKVKALKTMKDKKTGMSVFEARDMRDFTKDATGKSRLYK